MNRLDAYQLELSGMHLVEASAGTGKTHAITTLYLRAVTELGLLPSQILVVTFTRAATSEIKNRIRTRLRQAMLALTTGPAISDPALDGYLRQLRNTTQALERLRRAVQSIDDAAIFTIHGFCQRVLEQHAFESRTRFDQKLLESLDELRDEALNDTLVTELNRCHPVVMRRFLADGGPQRAAQLLRHTAMRPGLRILPEPTDSSALDDSIERFRNIQAATRHHYDFETIHGLLYSHRGLSQRRVNLAKLSGLLQILEPYAEVEPWPEKCFLQQSYLNASLKKGHDKAPEHAFFRSCDELFAAHQELEGILRAHQYALELACMSASAKLESERKASYAVQGFDDLLLSLSRALCSTGGDVLTRVLRERFPVAMIDEFQDTDPIQYSIFSKIYATRAATLFLIGDPKQSIYAFRGADLHAYISASSSSQLMRHSLDVNWRSDPGLIEAVNSLYTQRQNPFLFPEIEYRSMVARPSAQDSFDSAGQRISGLTLAIIEPDSPSASLKSRAVRKCCAEQTASCVRQWLGRNIAGRPILPKDIAILTRTNNEALLIQGSLRELDITSSLATDTSVLSSTEAGHFIAVLRALANPNDSSLVASALLTPGFGIAPYELIGRLDDPALWDRDSENFVRAHDWLLRQGIFGAFQYLFDAYDVIARLLQAPGGERQVTNLYHLMEIAELQQDKFDLLPLALLRSMQKLSEDPTEIAAESRQLRIESDEHAVTITTVHRSKGLEYPIVICPFLWSETSKSLTKNDLLVYHDDESGAWVADLRGKRAPRSALAASELEREAETHRLIYVALTRARHAVTVVVPQVKGIDATAVERVLAGARKLAESGSDRGHQPPSPSIRVERRVAADPSGTSRITADVPTLSWRPLTRRVSPLWTMSSFSALVAGQPLHTLNHFEEEGKDIDAQETPPQIVSAASAAARFHAMPPGAETGDILHKILESIDFAKFDPVADTIVEPLLGRLGVEVQARSTGIRQDIAAVLDASLLAHEPSFNLRRINAQRRRSELQFSMSAGIAATGGVTDKISPRRLAAALTPELTGLDRTYSQSVERLGFEPLCGYLRGFIDLVFEYDGRTYVIDYKSTSISDTIAGFTQKLVAETVAANHYALQMALYSLVMHRYLSWRVPDYDYDRDFGGTLLVFLRGVCPTQAPGHSVFFHRAPRSAIEALNNVFVEQEAR